MKILSVEESDLEGLVVYYEDGGQVLPYNLLDDMRGPFASSVRSLIKGFDVKSLELVQEQRKKKELEMENDFKKSVEEAKKNRLEKNKIMAKAIVSGDEDAIIKALSQ